MIAAWYLVVMGLLGHSMQSIPMATQQDCMVAENMLKDRQDVTTMCVPTGYGEKK